MRRLTLILLLTSLVSTAQINLRDNLKSILENEKVDTSRILLMAQLSNIYKDEKPVIGLSYAHQGISIRPSALLPTATC